MGANLRLQYGGHGLTTLHGAALFPRPDSDCLPRRGKIDQALLTGPERTLSSTGSRVLVTPSTLDQAATTSPKEVPADEGLCAVDKPRSAVAEEQPVKAPATRTRKTSAAAAARHQPQGPARTRAAAKPKAESAHAEDAPAAGARDARSTPGCAKLAAAVEHLLLEAEAPAAEEKKPATRTRRPPPSRPLPRRSRRRMRRPRRRRLRPPADVGPPPRLSPPRTSLRPKSWRTSQRTNRLSTSRSPPEAAMSCSPWATRSATWTTSTIHSSTPRKPRRTRPNWSPGMVADLSIPTTPMSPNSRWSRRCHTADPVKDYLKQIGKVALLNAEQEVDLAKRIEAGLFAEEQLVDGGASADDFDDYEWIIEDGRRAENHLLEGQPAAGGLAGQALHQRHALPRPRSRRTAGPDPCG